MRRWLALVLFACGARTGAIGDSFDTIDAATVDASVSEASDIDVAAPADAGQDVPDVARRACPGTCSSIGRTDPPMPFTDVTSVGIVISGRWRQCGPYGIGPDGQHDMVLDLRGADGRARFLNADGSVAMDVGAHVNVINENTILFTLEVQDAIYALKVWGCPNGTLSFSGQADIYYVAEP
jgi:hypothetical protein